MGSSTVKFLEIVQNPIKFRLFLLSKLPSAFFSGVRIKYADEGKAIVTIPYKWFSKNPFKSTYFACQSMAAEMSTGVLAMAFTFEQKPAVSMLVIKTEAVYLKKATGITTFTCEDGPMLKQAIDEAMASGKGTSFAARSIGKDKDGETVAEFTITWSFKAKPE
ncbi:MAG: DUF4442 domain-containing protein [Ferruginibacter sp.]